MLKGKKKKKMDNQTLIMTLSITPTILIGVIGILFLKIRNLRNKLNELNKNLNYQAWDYHLPELFNITFHQFDLKKKMAVVTSSPMLLK